MIEVSGTTCSAETCFPLNEVHIKVTTADGILKEQIKTGIDGTWQIPKLNEGDIVIFQKSGYVVKKYEAMDLPDKVRLLEDQLIGYQKKLHFQPDQVVDVYVNSSKPYFAKLCRYGEQRELIMDLGVFPAQKQLVPDGNFVDTGLHWNISFNYRLPDDTKPGIYSLLLQSEGFDDFAIPFVVSTPPSDYGKNTKLLVLASTNNWLAYNIWGGRSRYRNFENGTSDKYGNFSPSLIRRLTLRFLQ